MNYKFIISGGGTGGHIFPAISIANALKKRFPTSEILFVGAKGKMEMEKVPAAGYSIEGLPVRGFDRKKVYKNIKVLIDLTVSLFKARSIVRRFRPNVVIGVGGYASAPVLKAASYLGVSTLIQEQNSYAGVTNKLLAEKASCVCVAYDGMEKFFPLHKIVKTGNPVRQDLFEVDSHASEAYNFFGFNPQLKTLLILGGSLGARTINQSVINRIDMLVKSGVQVIWQTGKIYIDEAKKAVASIDHSRLVVTDFVTRMDFAYSIADVVVSRAGAGSISELCLLGKPSVLVPSPNVAEDHQTKNALALVDKSAALMIRDSEAKEVLVETALSLINDEDRLSMLREQMLMLAEPNSADRIVDEVVRIIKECN